MKREEIGTRELNKILIANHLMNEDEAPERGETLPPECHLRPSKICYFDLKTSNGEHPKTDDILTWQFKMEQAGRYDEIPDDPKEIIRMFDENPNLLDEFE